MRKFGISCRISLGNFSDTNFNAKTRVSLLGATTDWVQGLSSVEAREFNIPLKVMKAMFKTELAQCLISEKLNLRWYFLCSSDLNIYPFLKMYLPVRRPSLVIIEGNDWELEWQYGYQYEVISGYDLGAGL